MKRITVVTAGHLSTCPRMLKAADALAAAGHRVRVVSARHTPWADGADADLLARRADAWAWEPVDYRSGDAAAAYAWSGARRRLAVAAGRLVGPARLPAGVAARAYARAHPELVAAILAEPADLVYGGTTGALAAVAAASRRSGAPYALDLEDFHPAELEPGSDAGLAHGLADRILREVLPGARALTTSSEPMAAAYAERYGARPAVVHNVFPLPAAPPDIEPSPGEGLRLYWFSQTIGSGRGLEDAVRAAGLVSFPTELHLRGRAAPGYARSLERLAQEAAPQMKLFLHEPAPPDAMVPLCAGHDVGLSLESPRVPNHALCLSNKVFTYMLAGLALVLTDTPAQRALAADLGQGALGYAPGDAAALAAGLGRWAEDKRALRRARAASWEAARRRWHWEHPAERGALVALLERAMAR